MDWWKGGRLGVFERKGGGGVRRGLVEVGRGMRGASFSCT